MNLKQIALSLGLLIGLTASAQANCTSPVTLKDNNSNVQTMATIAGSDSNCYGASAISDGTTPTQKAAVTPNGSLQVGQKQFGPVGPSTALTLPATQTSYAPSAGGNLTACASNSAQCTPMQFVVCPGSTINCTGQINDVWQSVSGPNMTGGANGSISNATFQVLFLSASPTLASTQYNNVAYGMPATADITGGKVIGRATCGAPYQTVDTGTIGLGYHCVIEGPPSINFTAVSGTNYIYALELVTGQWIGPASTVITPMVSGVVN